MDRFEGRCWLDWWANSSTNKDLDGFAFLCDLDPVFTLRFEDASTFDVTVHPTDDHRGFTLTE
ncbi:hypothetical protein EV382_0386 [Micromonospora violae]|uniref:Uncharacterized protein n=1 Tax=Micromonospora violae TaxID=1278207 RepID=A0A4Q7UAS8_9ACTN|nr:hypothetical protein [Micromonospora violae]RZT77238.1 hypothetical protein EV382_0386 [Micromonospora violae]